MRLYETMMTGCTMLDRTSVSDGQGGFEYKWIDGATFKAAIIKDSSLEASRAEKEGVTEVYTVTTAKGASLDYHDVFRRDEDGAIFRVTSNMVDSETPDVATFQFGQVKAERWTLV